MSRKGMKQNKYYRAGVGALLLSRRDRDMLDILIGEGLCVALAGQQIGCKTDSASVMILQRARTRNKLQSNYQLIASYAKEMA
jgi:hypothetical protein